MRTRRGWPVIAVALAAALAGIVATSAGAAPRPTVKVVKTASLGKLLATSGGLTLYHYIDEKHGKIDCKGVCAKVWPPLLVGAGTKPIAGPGLRASKLGTIRRPDGRIQVTYNGLALYRYAPDRAAGDVKGQGFLKAWYVIAPSGKIVTRKVPDAAPSAPPATAPTDTTPTGGGYGYG